MKQFLISIFILFNISFLNAQYVWVPTTGKVSKTQVEKQLEKDIKKSIRKKVISHSAKYSNKDTLVYEVVFDNILYSYKYLFLKPQRDEVNEICNYFEYSFKCGECCTETLNYLFSSKFLDFRKFKENVYVSKYSYKTLLEVRWSKTEDTMKLIFQTLPLEKENYESLYNSLPTGINK